MLVPNLNSKLFVKNKQFLYEYLCSCKSMILGVGDEFSRKKFISFFLTLPKPLDKALTFQLPIEISSLTMIVNIEKKVV